MSKILLIAEHAEGQLNAGVAKAMDCAQQIGGDVDVAILAESGQSVAEQAAKLAGVTRVLVVDNAANAHPMAATLAPQIVALAQQGGYSHVISTNSTQGKDLMPRVAALLGVPQVTDIMAVHGPNSFDRPIYAGNAIITVEAPAEPLICGTVRLASFQPVASDNSAPVEAVSVDAEIPGHTRFQGVEIHKSDRPDLQSAPRVVSGGRALGSSENFEIIYKLADKIGAAVGASRAAVDSGYVPNDMQVGQTGKIIAPELYICAGISGAIQHLAGIKDARTIVAINKDEEAPIFEVADYGLVGDLFEVVPQLAEKL
ncbi:electron transfer flavoprotein subunit alpha/FixB family protein [Algiphilus sp.]|uniref:electron transfer flavoprotein subunit alpha/FixB family protein n=1 Tax=Algiphilus sp. TaxID=1872431 RepID=UPI003B526381